MKAEISVETQNQTPLPWHILTVGKRHYVYAEQDILVAVVDRQFPEAIAKANADLIIQACNSYNALLAACTLALEVIRRHDAGQTGCAARTDTALASYCGEDCLTDPDAVDGIADVLIKAIAKAGGVE